MNDFVFVTALYNSETINRDDSRSWEDYLKWFEKTLHIKSPFIVFCEKETASFVKDVRGDLPTHIVETKFEDIPLYSLLNPIQDILDSDDYKGSMSDPNRVECKKSLYLVIQYSKFKWLKESVDMNPFDSKYYFWLDAGASRHLTENDYKNPYPSQEALMQLDGIGDTFLIQYNPDYYPDLISTEVLPKNYLLDNRSFICGSMFGGNSNSVTSIDKEIDDILNYMVENKCVNNEQISLGYLCKEREELFTRFYRNNPNKHLNLFGEMA